MGYGICAYRVRHMNKGELQSLEKRDWADEGQALNFLLLLHGKLRVQVA